MDCFETPLQGCYTSANSGHGVNENAMGYREKKCQTAAGVNHGIETMVYRKRESDRDGRGRVHLDMCHD